MPKRKHETDDDDNDDEEDKDRTTAPSLNSEEEQLLMQLANQCKEEKLRTNCFRVITIFADAGRHDLTAKVCKQRFQYLLKRESRNNSASGGIAESSVASSGVENFVELERASAEFFLTVSDVFRGCPEWETKYSVEKIDRITNADRRRNYEDVQTKFRQQHGASVAHRLLHGCTLAASSSIVEHGFKPGSSGTLGAAIYLTDSLEKALQYPKIGGSTRDHVLLVVDVLLGRPIVTGQARTDAYLPSLQAMGFDSIVGRQATPNYEPGFWRTEFAVFDSGQALPLYRVIVKCIA